jgi:DNA polymerase-3 subunit gamma/tau
MSLTPDDLALFDDSIFDDVKPSAPAESTAYVPSAEELSATRAKWAEESPTPAQPADPLTAIVPPGAPMDDPGLPPPAPKKRGRPRKESTPTAATPTAATPTAATPTAATPTAATVTATPEPEPATVTATPIPEPASLTVSNSAALAPDAARVVVELGPQTVALLAELLKR